MVLPKGPEGRTNFSLAVLNIRNSLDPVLCLKKMHVRQLKRKRTCTQTNSPDGAKRTRKDWIIHNRCPRH